MRMRRIHLYILLSIFFSLAAFGQGSADTNLNVVLMPIQSIKVNEAQSNVNVSLSTASEYMNGKTSAQHDHIEIMSSSDYEVKVSASTHLLGDTASIDIGTVTVTPSFGNTGGAPTGNIILTPQALSFGNNTLVQSSQGDSQRTFNVEYHVSGGQAYLNKPAGTYTTTITYTILAP